MKLLRLLTLVAALAAPNVARAAGITTIQADLKAPGPMAALKAPGPNAALKPSSAMGHIAQVNPDGLARLTPSTPLGSALVARLGPVQSGGTRSLGEINIGLRNLSYPTAPASLGLRGQRSLTPLSEQQLNLQLGIYRKIEAEQIDHIKPQPLNTSDLAAGVALPNGWVLKFHAENRYSIYDRALGRGFTVWGDPHFSTDVSGRADASHSSWYGDFTSSTMVIVLPAVSASERVIVVARSTGGSAADGYGLPTDVMVISDTKSVYASGLNTKSPTGYVSGDGYFLHKAHKSTIDSAPVLFWDEGSGELRHSSGDRSAPPAHAKKYAASTPKLSRDNEQTLHKGEFRLAWGAVAGDPTEPELQAIYGQALSGTKSTIPAVQSGAKAYVADTKKYAQTMTSYVGDRVQVIATLEKVQARISQIVKDLSDPSLTADQIEALAKELEALKRQAKENIGKLEQLEGATPRK